MKRLYQLLRLSLFLSIILSSAQTYAETLEEPGGLILQEFGLDLSQTFSVDQIRREYNERIRLVDVRIDGNPHNIMLKIAKCDFIRDLMYQWEYSEGFGFLEEDSAACEGHLEDKYAYHPEVILRLLEYEYGEEFFRQARATERQIADVIWTSAQKARLYEMLASRSAYDNAPQAIRYGEKALALDAHSAFRLTLASLHAQTGASARAVEIAEYAFLQRESLSAPELQNLLSIYADTEQKVLALSVYQILQDRGEHGGIQIAKDLATAGHYELASREFASQGSTIYGAERLQFERFKFEFQNGSKDAAYSAYVDMRDAGLAADPLGTNRIALFVKHPDLPWSLRDFGTIFLSIPAIFAVVLLLGIPFTIIHYIALARAQRGKLVPQPGGLGLRYSWLAFSYCVLGLMIPFAILSPTDFVGEDLWFSDGAGVDRRYLADATLLGSLLSIGLLLPLTKRWNRLGGGWLADRHPLVPSIMAGVAFGFAMRLPGFLKAEMLPEITEYFSRFTEQGIAISAVTETYGWPATVWMVVIAAPVVEEFVFRGAILGGLRRYLTFGWANLIQALLFASLHAVESISASAYIFVVGGMLGLLKKEYEGLLVPILAHATFNGVFVYWMMT